MHWMEAEELAAHVLGLDPDNFDGSEIEEKLFDKFEISFEQFREVAESLMPFTVAARTALGNNLCKGFAHNGSFICKIDA